MEINHFPGDPTDVSSKKGLLLWCNGLHKWEVRPYQCFVFSRNNGQVTPKNIYFYDLMKYFPDQNIRKTFYLSLKKEALVRTTSNSCSRNFSDRSSISSCLRCARSTSMAASSLACIPQPELFFQIAKINKEVFGYFHPEKVFFKYNENA